MSYEFQESPNAPASSTAVLFDIDLARPDNFQAPRRANPDELNIVAKAEIREGQAMQAEKAPPQNLLETLPEKLEKKNLFPEMWHSNGMKDVLIKYHKEGYSQQVAQQLSDMVAFRIGNQGQFGVTSAQMTDARAAFRLAGHHGKFDEFLKSVETRLPKGVKFELKDDPKGYALHTNYQVWSGQSEAQKILYLRGGTDGDFKKQWMVFSNKEINK